jgi:uncharacterized phage protein (TIGR01671 family)
MREIKFRAWHLGSKRYLVSSNALFGGNLEWKGGNAFLLQPSADVVLEQFTGMHDRIGREIYEGDVIVVVDAYPFFDDGKPNYVAVVEWVYGSWQQVLRCINRDKRGISDGINEHLDYDGSGGASWTVIGNIHEYPLPPLEIEEDLEQTG